MTDYRSTMRVLRCLPFFILFGVQLHAMADSPATTAEWVAPVDGVWSDATKWSTPNFPDKGTPSAADTYDVVIDADGGPYTVRLDGNYWANSLTIGSDAQLDIDYAALNVSDSITLDGGTINLTTTLALNTYSLIRFAVVDGTEKVIGGTGVIRFADGRNIDIFGPHVGGLRIEAGITVDALARLGTIDTGAGPLTNYGTLRSSGVGLLELRGTEFKNFGTVEIGGRTAFYEPWQNSGTMMLMPQGVAEVHTDVTLNDLRQITNLGGQFELHSVLDLEGQTVDFAAEFLQPLRMRGGTIRNGRITSSSGPPMEMFDELEAAFWDNVTLATDFTVPYSAGVWPKNGLHLDGSTLSIHAGATVIFLEEGQVLDGIGTVVPIRRPNSTSRSTLAGPDLMIGEGVTVRGDSNVLFELGFGENQGLITADVPNSVVRIGDVSVLAPGGTWTNRGTIATVGSTSRMLLAGQGSNAGTLIADTSTISVDGSLTLTPESVLELILEPGFTTGLQGYGNISLGGELQLTVRNPLQLSVGDQFTIVRSDERGGLSGQFASIPDRWSQGGLELSVQYNAQSVVVSVVRVPEPSSLGLVFLTLALAGSLGAGKCRQ